MLLHRGMNLNSDMCVLCNSQRETDTHLLLHCAYTHEVWMNFVKALRISWVSSKTIQNLVEEWNFNMLRGRSKLRSCCYDALRIDMEHFGGTKQ